MNIAYNPLDAIGRANLVRFQTLAHNDDSPCHANISQLIFKFGTSRHMYPIVIERMQLKFVT